MKGQNFGILYILLVVCQIVICNYFQLTPYVTLSILPVMVLCIPLHLSTAVCMIIAFASGLAVDWLSEGIVGLNVAALVAVAFARKGVIRIFLGEDLISRSESFTIRKNGMMKISAAMLVMLGLFFAIYVISDGAGTRPLWFNMVRWGASVAVSFIVSLAVVRTLAPDDRK